MTRSHQASKRCRQTTVSLQFERLEQRLPLSVNVSGNIFWDANRNGEDDDPAVAHDNVAVTLTTINGTTANGSNASATLNGDEVGFQLANISDFSDKDYEVNTITAALSGEYELTSPLLSSLADAGEESYILLEGQTTTNPSWIDAVDLDGVNGPDLIITNFLKQKLSILLNDGSGGFSRPSIEVPVPPNATSIASADFDDDGDIDLAIGVGVTSQFTVLINDGTGTFQSPGSVLPIDSGVGPFSVLAVDVNADGKPDLVSSDFYDKTVSIYINESTPGQVAFASRVPFDVGNGGGSGSGSGMIVAANLTGQPGLPSLVVLNTVLDTLLIFDNDGSGGFTYNPNTNVDAQGSKFVTAGRINADAIDDIVLYVYNKQEVPVYFGDDTIDGGNGGFEAVPIVPQTVWYPAGIGLADMDGDGDTDLVASLVGGQKPVILRNEGGNTISDTLPQFGVPLDAIYNVSPALADFDGDGTIDIAYSPAWGGGTIKVSLRKLGDGQQIARTNEGDLFGRDFGVARVVSSASSAGGDYDGDGTVNGLDLKVWKANFGRTAGPGMSADSNGSNQVDGADFLSWQRNLGNTVAPVQALAETAAATVPTEIDSLVEAVAIDANIAWLSSANFAFSSAGSLRTSLTQTQLKDVVFTSEAVSDSQLRALRNNLSEIRVPSQSQETLLRRAAYKSPTVTLFADLDQQGFFEGFDFETE